MKISTLPGNSNPATENHVGSCPSTSLLFSELILKYLKCQDEKNKKIKIKCQDV